MKWLRGERVHGEPQAQEYTPEKLVVEEKRREVQSSSCASEGSEPRVKKAIGIAVRWLWMWMRPMGLDEKSAPKGKNPSLLSSPGPRLGASLFACGRPPSLFRSSSCCDMASQGS
jgi:hypothetical protein